MKVYITVTDAGGTSRTLSIEEKQSIRIGRSKTANIAVDDALCSGSHCRVYLDGHSVMVEELDSKNGIRLNGIRVLKQRIFIHDEIQLGESYLYIEKSKLDPGTLEILSSDNPASRIEGDLTLDLRTVKQNLKKIRGKVSNKKS